MIRRRFRCVSLGLGFSCWLLLTAFVSVPFAGIIVVVRDQHGNEKARLRVDDGDRVEIVQTQESPAQPDASGATGAANSAETPSSSQLPKTRDAGSLSETHPAAVSLELEPDLPSGKVKIFAPAWSDEAVTSLTEALTRDGTPVATARIKNLSEIDAKDSAVIVVAMDASAFLKVGEYNPDALRRRKIIGIGSGAAKLYGELGLNVNWGACAHGVVGPPRIQLKPNRLIDKSLVMGPFFVFEPPILDTEKFHNSLFFGMYVGDKKPQRRDLVEIIALQTVDQNYAPVVRQGDKVLVCVDATADQWSPVLGRLVRELTLALDSHRLPTPPAAAASADDDVAVVKKTHPVNGHTYQLIRGADPGAGMTWTEANDQARRLGGYLVTITSDGERRWLIDNFPPDEEAKLDYCLWIGLTDAESEGDFKWVTGEPVHFTAWNTIEPNDAGGDEDYVHIYNFANGLYQWNDLPDAPMYNTHGKSYPISAIVEFSPPTAAPVRGERTSAGEEDSARSAR